MYEGRDEFGDIFVEIGFGEVAVAGGIIETDMDSGLEEIVFSNDRVEERLHIDASVFVSIELEEGGGGKEVSELEW